MTNRLTIGAVALALTLTGCSGAGPKPAGAPDLLPAKAIDSVLLKPDQVDAIMKTTGMVAHPRVDVMSDHRNLLPNLNCLGIWQVNEAGVYGKDGWIALRQELLRVPDTDAWNDLVVQSVVNYPSTEAARNFFTASTDRWSKCTNHNVNITLNDKRLPSWHSGELTKTDTRLTIPLTRGNANNGVDRCQRTLGVESNVIIDVQACTRDLQTKPPSIDVADQIAAKLPR
jgi:hypothetical protein